MKRNTQLPRTAFAVLAFLSLGVVFAAAAPQQATTEAVGGATALAEGGTGATTAASAKPKPAAVVGGGQYSPFVGQTFPNRVYWGVAHVHTATLSTRECSGSR